MAQVHKLPARDPANLIQIKDIEEEHRFDISGYSLKDMTCDPFGHPVFASSDTKAGFAMCYDCEDQRVLRRITPAQHSIDSVAFDSQNNFILACDNGKERSVAKYNIRGDKLKKFTVVECEKILGVVCSCDDNIIASIRRSEHQCLIRVYKQSGEIVTSLIKNKRGEQLFIKPVYMAVTGNRLIVGDVGLKNLTAYDIPEPQIQTEELEKASPDEKVKSVHHEEIPDKEKFSDLQKKTLDTEKEPADFENKAADNETESAHKTADRKSAESMWKKVRDHVVTSVDSATEVTINSVWSIKIDIPRGIEVDGGGNILACDFKNNRLTLINKDGKLIGHAITTVSRPQFVSINKNKLFIIDEGRGTSYRMTVYSLHKSHRKNRKKPNWQ